MDKVVEALANEPETSAAAESADSLLQMERGVDVAFHLEDIKLNSLNPVKMTVEFMRDELNKLNTPGKEDYPSWECEKPMKEVVLMKDAQSLQEYFDNSARKVLKYIKTCTNVAMKRVEELELQRERLVDRSKGGKITKNYQNKLLRRREKYKTANQGKVDKRYKKKKDYHTKEVVDQAMQILACSEEDCLDSCKPCEKHSMTPEEMEKLLDEGEDHKKSPSPIPPPNDNAVEAW